MTLRGGGRERESVEVTYGETLIGTLSSVHIRRGTTVQLVHCTAGLVGLTTAPYLLVLAEEASTPAALAARSRVDALSAGQDLVTGGGVIAPRQLGTAGHVRVQYFRGVLQRR